MIQDIEKYEKEIDGYVIESSAQLEEFRLTYLSRKGIIAQLFEDFKNLQGEGELWYNRVVIKKYEKRFYPHRTSCCDCHHWYYCQSDFCGIKRCSRQSSGYEKNC
jgi:hypothetical protein